MAGDEPGAGMTAPQAGEIVDLAALIEEHAYITSVDVCGFCGDSECDGIGCIACIDPDLAGGGDNWHYDRMENLHDLLRQGQAWRVMQTLRCAGADPLDALVLAASSLAGANNQRPWPPADGEHYGRSNP